MTKKTRKKDTKSATKAKSTAKSTKSKPALKVRAKSTSTKKTTASKSKTVKAKPNYKVLSIILLVGLLVTFLFVIRNQIIVASVNGSPITRYALIKELEKQGGKQVLEGLVVQKIIDQEANKKGIKVVDRDIDTEIDKLRGQIPQGMTLEQMLKLQGGDIQSLRQQLVLQIKLRKLLQDQISVTDDEVNTAYEGQKDAYVDLSEQEAKSKIKESLIQQKLSAKINTWLEQKKKEANIKYYMFAVKTEPTPNDQGVPKVQEQPTKETSTTPSTTPKAE